MNVEQHISDLIKAAMKSGDKARLMALRGIKSVITNERTRHSGDLPEEDAIKVIAAHRKKMIGAREQYEDAGRDELTNQATLEISVCEELLPEQLSGENLEQLVVDTIEKVGAKSPADLGKVMGPLMKELAGKADGNEVRKMVSEKLGG